MNPNRVASNSSIGSISWDLSRDYKRLMTIQDQISSGKSIMRPSDNPGGTGDALAGRATVRRNDQYLANATDATGWLNLTDSTLSSVQDQLIQARERIVQAINGASTPTSREAIAGDIEALKANLTQLANTTYQSRSIFSGTAAATTAAYAGATYQGDAGAVNRTIADGVTVQVNATGPSVFGTPNAADPLNGDVFQMLDTMAAAVRSNDPATMNSSIASVAKAADRVSLAQTKIGGMTRQVEQTINRTQRTQIDVIERLSSIEDIDIAEALIGLQSQQAAYQAALGVTARIIQPSLMDFLR